MPKDGKKANVIPVIKKGKQEYAGNCRPVSLTLVPEKVIEQLIPGNLSRYTNDKKPIMDSPRGTHA